MYVKWRKYSYYAGVEFFLLDGGLITLLILEKLRIPHFAAPNRLSVLRSKVKRETAQIVY